MESSVLEKGGGGNNKEIYSLFSFKRVIEDCRCEKLPPPLRTFVVLLLIYRKLAKAPGVARGKKI